MPTQPEHQEINQRNLRSGTLAGTISMIVATLPDRTTRCAENSTASSLNGKRQSIGIFTKTPGAILISKRKGNFNAVW